MKYVLALLMVLLCKPALAQSTAPDASDPPAGSGHWEAGEVGFAPWIFDLHVDGNSVTGTIGQGARDPATGMITSLTGPFEISRGEIDGQKIEFRVRNGRTVVQFEGTVSGDEIRFRRRVNINGGYSGILGGNGATEFVARRGHAEVVPATPILSGVRGMTVDLAAVQAAGDLDEMLDSLSRQIGIVEEAVQDPEKLAFLKSIPLGWLDASPTQVDDAVYAGGKVTLRSRRFTPENPVLLHELMHAYHDQRLPGGFGNADIQALYEQAVASGQFPAGSYMLTRRSEYFAMMASVYLHGSAAREPFTREDIQQKQPEFYAWMEKEFGPK